MIRFRLGPFPVFIDLSFVITALLIGFLGPVGDTFDPAKMTLWLLVVGVSVLVHELGHAGTAVALGLDETPSIFLTGMGGLTRVQPTQRPLPSRLLFFSVAGPLAGLSLGGAAWLLERATGGASGALGEGLPHLVIGWFKATSVYWAMLNLLPVLPLDGGHVLEQGLTWWRKKPSEAVASWASMVLSVVLAAVSFLADRQLTALLFASFAFSNGRRAYLLSKAVEALPAGPEVDPRAQREVESAIEVARRALESGDAAGAGAAADQLESSNDLFRQAAGLRIRAGVLLFVGDLSAAALQAGRSYAMWQSVDAAVVAARASLRAGERERASNWLRRAVEAGAPLDAVRGDPELGSLT